MNLSEITAPVAVRASIETRCYHGMLQWPLLGLSSCSICRGLAYTVVSIDGEIRLPVEEIDAEIHLPVTEPLVWLRSEVRTECAWCSAPIREGHEAAFVPALDGPIGRCCQEQVA